jgi:hypothetical protein
LIWKEKDPVFNRFTYSSPSPLQKDRLVIDSVLALSLQALTSEKSLLLDTMETQQGYIMVATVPNQAIAVAYTQRKMP